MIPFRQTLFLPTDSVTVSAFDVNPVWTSLEIQQLGLLVTAAKISLKATCNAYNVKTFPAKAQISVTKMKYWLKLSCVFNCFKVMNFFYLLNSQEPHLTCISSKSTGTPAAEKTSLTLVINSGPMPSPGISVTRLRPLCSVSDFKRYNMRWAPDLQTPLSFTIYNRC